MRRSITILLTLLILLPLAAAALTVDEIVERVKAVYAEAETLSCDLRRVTTSAMLGQRRVLIGTLRMALPDRFHIAYTTPQEQYLTCDGETVWMYTPQNEQVVYGPVEDYRERRMLADLVGYFERDYAYILDGTEEVNGRTTHRLAMTAREADNPYPAGALWIDAGLWLPVMVELVDDQGYKLSYRLSNIELNVDLPAGIFGDPAPAGVERVEVNP